MLQRLKTFLGGHNPEIDGVELRGQPPISSGPRIVIVRAGAIGDTLMATPLVRAVRSTFANAHVTFICSNAARDVLAHNPHLDRVIGLSYRHVPLALSPEKTRIVRFLKKIDLDWAVVLESHRSFVDLACRFNPAHVVAYGTLPGKRIEKVMFDPNKHSVENNLHAGEALGVQPAGLEMELHYPPAIKASLQARLGRAGISSGDVMIGLHAGWGGRQQPLEQTRLRSWPPKRFAAIARWLTETLGARVVLTGSLNDRPLTDFIAQNAAVPCVNLAGSLSVLELAALIDRLDAYVAIESGPAHMAAALGTPLVALLGPAIFQQTRPLTGRGTVHVIRHQVPCSPCYGTPLQKSCKDNVCMKQIEVSEVQEAIMTAIGQVTGKCLQF